MDEAVLDVEEDDRSIPDESELWRLIAPSHIVPDKNRGDLRPASAAFSDHPKGPAMSVFLAEVLHQENRTPESVLKPGYGLASIKAGLARECGQRLVRRPLPEEPAHAWVVGKKTKPIKRRLAKAASWVFCPGR